MNQKIGQPTNIGHTQHLKQHRWRLYPEDASKPK
jgi:hypothetical protein